MVNKIASLDVQNWVAGAPQNLRLNNKCYAAPGPGRGPCWNFFEK